MYDIIIGRNKEDQVKYGTQATILIGKHYVKMGRITSLSNKVLMDVAKSHVVFICGKRGSGKCLTGDSLISLGDGRLVQIKDLEHNYNQLMALNHHLKITSSEKVGFYKRKVNKLLKIKLRSGKEIKLTPEHPLLTVLGWKKAENLKASSRIATPSVCPNFGNRIMKESEIKLLAYLIAEGHTKKPVLFCNTDDCIIEDFKQAVFNFDSTLEVTRQGNYNYRINSRKVTRKPLNKDMKRDDLGRITKENKPIFEKTSIRVFLEKHKLYGLSALEKFVPEQIMMLPKHQLALFLNRIFSCDGSIYKTNGGWQISYSSSSNKLITKVQHLLSRFGIYSRIRNKKIKEFFSFEIVIYGSFVDKFINEIGFFGEKQKKQQLALVETKSIIKNPNINTIPKEIWDIYRPSNWATIGREMGYKTPKALRSSINYAPSRQKLLQIAEVDNNERIKALANSDIFWDEIVEINELFGNFDVYDISVPELHNFVANDIIVHNSYTMGVMAESMMDLPSEVRKNLSIIMLDTMGIYWTMKYPNKQEKGLLDEWGLEAKPLNVNIFTPLGYYKQYKEEGIPTDFPFSIRTSELSSFEWSEVFEIDLNTSIGSLIERTIETLKESKESYDIDDIVGAIQKDDRSPKEIKDAAENRFISAKHWGLFSKQGTLMEDLIIPGQITVLDVSCYTHIPGAQGLRALVIGLVSQKMFTQRMIARKSEEYESIYRETHLIERDEEEEKEPIIWLFIDEAHEFLPIKGKTVASQPLITVLREGRQPGISLVLATQQPGKIHTDVITQSDIVISHRLTAKIDTQALGAIMQSYMREGLDTQLNYLPRVKGAAVIFDDSNEKIYPMRVRPRYTWHGGSAPSIVIQKKKIFEF
jgi:intein/homing endonuclease